MGWLESLRQQDPGTSLVHRLWWDLLRVVCWGIITLFYGYRSWGANNIPKTGPVLLICNHQSYLDLVVIGIGLNRHFHSMARSTLFKNRFFARLIESLNAFPVEQGRGDTKAVRTALKKLTEQRLLLLFPEGTRSPNGQLQPFRDGVMLLVRRGKCPVVPMAVEGVYDIWPVHGKLRLGGRIGAMYGEPIAADELSAMKPADARARLEREIESMRLKLRRTLRHQSGGRYPKPGPADRSAPFVHLDHGPHADND